jgi:hypothetical protein
MAIFDFNVIRYEELFEYLDYEVNAIINCNNTLKFTRRFCKENKLDTKKVIKRLGDKGGYCDCEVLENARGRILGMRKMEVLK